MKRILSGFHIIDVNADGNCLFNSISICMVGSEYLATILRLFAVLQAVIHFDRYTDKVYKQVN